MSTKTMVALVLNISEFQPIKTKECAMFDITLSDLPQREALDRRQTSDAYTHMFAKKDGRKYISWARLSSKQPLLLGYDANTR